MSKVDKYLIFILIAMILCVSACGQNMEKAAENIEKTESMTETGDTEEIYGTDSVKEKEEETSWVNHYYNQGIYVKDNVTYRQFPDGLYRREAGSEEWELLFENPMKFRKGLTCYGDRLYFTGYQEEADVLGSGWNNTVFYYDLDTGDQGQLLTTDELASEVTVYDGCLYFEYMNNEHYMVYDGYRLNEDGSIEEKLDTESEDFLCFEQNQYNESENEMMKYYPDSRNPKEREARLRMEELKDEVISIPACAAMLNGKVVLSQKKDESSRSIFLRDVKSGEDMFLFDASYIMAVTRENIFYWDSNGDFCSYSFKEKNSKKIEDPQSPELEEIGLSSVYMTWDENAFYFYQNFGESEIPRILRVDMKDWSFDIVAEGEVLRETEYGTINQVDDEYFYHGDQMYPLQQKS